MATMVSLSLVLLFSWTVGRLGEPCLNLSVQKDKIVTSSRRRAKVARRVSKSCQSRRGLGGGKPGQSRAAASQASASSDLGSGRPRMARQGRWWSYWD